VTNSVTYYYRKKEDPATACVLRAIEVFDQIVVQAATEPTVEARVRRFFAIGVERLAAVQAGTLPPLVLFSDTRALPPPQIEVVFTAYTGLFRHLRELLRTPAMQHLSRAELNARTHLVLSHANGLQRWLLRYEIDAYPRVAQQLADIVLDGIAGCAAHWADAAGLERHWHLSDSAESTSEAFLRAATVLVNEQGYRGASVDRISARLNLTKGSFYHHHDNKDDLIAACFERTFSVVRRAMRLAAAGPGSGWQKLCALARALLQYQMSPEGPLLSLSALSALPDRAHRDGVRLTLARLNESLAGLVVDGMVDGSIRSLDPAIAAHLVSGAINAGAEVPRWVPGATRDNVADLYVRPVFDGLLRPRGTA
jgi:AcrR family transcriptional regulator